MSQAITAFDFNKINTKTLESQKYFFHRVFPTKTQAEYYQIRTSYNSYMNHLIFLYSVVMSDEIKKACGEYTREHRKKWKEYWILAFRNFNEKIIEIINQKVSEEILEILKNHPKASKLQSAFMEKMKIWQKDQFSIFLKQLGHKKFETMELYQIDEFIRHTLCFSHLPDAETFRNL